MELTTSYENVFDQTTIDRYHWLETRNAARIMKATNPDEFDDFVTVLDAFKIDPAIDIRTPGGNESDTAGRLNKGFRDRGWREGSYAVGISSTLKLLPWADVGETEPVITASENDAVSYLVDNIKGRIAIDVEWHAKDGNLDRDLAAYRTLYDAGIIDAAAIVTNKRAEMRQWALDEIGPLGPDGKKNTKFATSTTTNLEKATTRVERGDAGGCPILIVAVGRQTV